MSTLPQSSDTLTVQRTSKRWRDILAASLRCVLKHGVEAATIEQIREASGASSGSIYHHFGSKRGIAVALYVEGTEQLVGVFEEAVRGRKSLRAGIRSLLKSHFEWMAEHRDWALYLLRVSTADLSREDSRRLEEINRRMRGHLAEWLRPFAERGEIVALPEELYFSIVFGASSYCARHWLVGRMPLDPTSAAEQLATAAWKALRAE